MFICVCMCGAKGSPSIDTLGIVLKKKKKVQRRASVYFTHLGKTGLNVKLKECIKNVTEQEIKSTKETQSDVADLMVEPSGTQREFAVTL